MVNEIDWTWVAKTHTSLLKVSQLTMRTRAKTKPWDPKNHLQKQVCCDVVSHRAPPSSQAKNPAALKVPRSKVASINGRHLTEPGLRAGRLDKWNKQRRKLTKKPNGHSDWAPESLCGDGPAPEGQPSLQRSTNLALMAEWLQRSLCSVQHEKAHLDLNLSKVQIYPQWKRAPQVHLPTWQWA